MVIDARGRQVDHHHACLGVALEVIGVFQRGGADACRQTELGVVGHGQCFVIVLDAYHAGHGAEDLLAADTHVGRGVDEQRRRQEISLATAVHALAAAGQARTFLLAEGDVAQVLIELGLGHHGADIDALLQRRTDLDLADTLDHGRDEAVVDAFCDDQAAGCRATLAGGVEGALGREFDGRIKVGIIEDDLRVLAAHLQLDLGPTVDAGSGDAAADTHRAGKADAVDPRVADQRLADFTSLAHHQVEHPGREARARDDLGDGPGATRYQVGRLDHHAIAVGQRRGDLPGGNGDGEIPRRDQADHPQRLACHLDAHTRANRLQHFPGLAQAFAGEELEDIARAGDLADGFGQGLALLARQQRAQLLASGEDFQPDLFQRIGTRLDAAGRPGGKRLARRCDRRVHLCRVGLGVFTDDIGQVGWVDVGLVLVASDPLAVDVVVVTLQVCHGALLLGCHQSAGGFLVVGRWMGGMDRHCAPCFSISAASRSYSSGSSSVSGARTGPASCPAIRAPALTMLTA